MFVACACCRLLVACLSVAADNVDAMREVNARVLSARALEQVAVSEPAELRCAAPLAFMERINSSEMEMFEACVYECVRCTRPQVRAESEPG